MAGKGRLPLPWLVEWSPAAAGFNSMQTKKAYFSLISLAVTVIIISVLISLILNTFYFSKLTLDAETQTDRYTDGVGQPKYDSILQRSKRLSESIKKKVQAQERQLNY